MANSERKTEDICSEKLARVAVKIPPMWKSNITVWFVQVEANFSVAQINNDLTKYNYLIASIDTETLSAVTDLIVNPPDVDKYQTLKNRIIQEFSDTQSQQIRKLLSELTLGDKKPSVLLRQMSELAQNSVTKEFLKTIWLERLPTHTQAILSVSSAELTELAILADKINEIKTEPAAYAITKVPDTTLNEKNDQIAELQSQIKQLSIQIAKISGARTSRPYFRNRSNYRYKSNTRRGESRSPRRNQTNERFCFYHAKFGKNARKCREPCTFEQNKKN